MERPVVEGGRGGRGRVKKRHGEEGEVAEGCTKGARQLSTVESHPSTAEPARSGRGSGEGERTDSCDSEVPLTELGMLS
jgi:hypothetical protein